MTTLSQDEISAMLSGLGVPDAEAPEAPEVFDMNDPQFQLTAEEIDVLGEVGNICMGAVATTMYTLLGRRTEITTPKVSVHPSYDVLQEYETPFVVVDVEYVEGIDGQNMLLLSEPDAALITDLLMGGEGQLEEPVQLSELHMSAISEIMNQMIGAAASAMAKVLGTAVNISTPKALLVGLEEDVGETLDCGKVLVRISFSMEIEGLLKSQLLQMIPFSISRQLVRTVQERVGIGTVDQEVAIAEAVESAPTEAAASAAVSMAFPPAAQPSYTPPVAEPRMEVPQMSQNVTTQTADPAPLPREAYPSFDPAAAASAYGQPMQPVPGKLVDVRPMQYNSFDAKGPSSFGNQGIDLVHDIPLTVTVELGRTRKDISEILEFGLGTVLVLDKMAGDPVEIMVNGKLIARGEVVVIDENYGVRITDILNG